jgi:tetratricopeptide (TPR) repeat protein
VAIEVTGGQEDPDATAVLGAGADDEPQRERGLTVGELVGRYVLVGEIGRGAMGRVYRAYDPRLSREVALKVLGRAKANAAATAARVIREAQALAKLNHPNVVAVYDVGQSSERYFIAMELVAGSNLVQWLGKERRSWREILDVMLGAGRGLAAAHAAGLVHRDLKPGNILVGDDGRVRVTDFGLARGGVFTSSSVGSIVQSIPQSIRDIDEALTDHGTILGTPAYMAPEQHLGKPLDGRTDAYAFCVTLWEAVCGQRPFPGKTADELCINKKRMVPTWPAGEPAWLGAVLVRGLAADPDARHASMEDLLAALERDPSKWRRRSFVALASVAAIGLVVGGFGLARGSRGSACSDPQVQLAGVWDHARRDEVEHAFSSTAFAADTWPHVALGLDDWAARWMEVREAECVGEPGLPAHLAMQRAVCLAGRKQQFAALTEVLVDPDPGVVERAVVATTKLPRPESCADASYLSASVPPPEDANVAAAVDAIRETIAHGKAQRDAGRLEPARLTLQEALAQARELAHDPIVGEAQLEVGTIEWLSGRYADAEASLESAYELLVAVGDDEHAAEAATRLTALVGDDLARPTDGHRWSRHAHALIKRGDLGLPLQAALATAIGSVYQGQGEYADAKRQHERSLALAIELDGETSSAAVVARGNLANTLSAMGALVEARALHERVLEERRALVGDRHPEVAETLNNLAGVQIRQSKLESAITTLEEAVAIIEGSVGKEHPLYASVLSNLGIAHRQLGDDAIALHYYEEALATFERMHGPSHVQVATTAINLGNTLWGMGRPEDADAHFRRALSILEGAYGRKHPDVAGALNARAIALHSLHRTDEALALLQESLAIYEELLGPDHVRVALQTNNIGVVLHDQGKDAQAKPYLERALAIRKRALGEHDPTVAGPLTNLGDVARAQADPSTAMQHYQEAIALTTEGFGEKHPDLIQPLAGLGHVYFERGELGPAVKAYERALELGLDAAFDEEIDAKVRLQLGIALSKMQRDPERARTLVEQARDAYRAQGDVAGEAAAVAALP